MKTTWPAFRCGCLIVAGVLLGGSTASVRGQDAAGANTAAAVISSVAITQDTQRAAIRVEGAGRLDVHAARMQNPERLVLDFSGARLNVQKTSIPGVSAPVRGVRLGQFRPDVARVVIDLTTTAPYQIAHEGDAIVVYLEVQPSDANAGPVVASTSSPTTRPKRETVSTAQNSQAAAANQTGGAHHFPLPNELTKPTASLAAVSEPAHTENGAQQAAQQAVQQASTAASTVAAQQAAVPAGASSSSRYTGEPISVNLKDVDLKDFFRLIHEISGLNVVLDPNVKGSVTIVLDDVPWDQALAIVLDNNGLACTLQGNVLRIATLDTMKTEAEARRAQLEAQALAVPKQTITRYLSYGH